MAYPYSLLPGDTVVVVEHCPSCHRTDETHIQVIPANPVLPSITTITGWNYAHQDSGIGIPHGQSRREFIRPQISTLPSQFPEPILSATTLNNQKKLPLQSVRLPPLEDPRFDKLMKHRPNGNRKSRTARMPVAEPKMVSTNQISSAKSTTNQSVDQADQGSSREEEQKTIIIPYSH